MLAAWCASRTERRHHLGMQLLIAGIPGTGKSQFARWLVQSHGFAHFDVDNPSHRGRSVDRWLAQQRLVIDWGFPVSELQTVEWLVERGVSHWWFDGDRDAAAESFLYSARRKASTQPRSQIGPADRRDHWRLATDRSRVSRAHSPSHLPWTHVYAQRRAISPDTRSLTVAELSLRTRWTTPGCVGPCVRWRSARVACPRLSLGSWLREWAPRRPVVPLEAVR